MKTKLLLLVLASLFSVSFIAQIQIGTDIDGEAASDKSGISVSMPDMNTVAIGAPYNNNGNGIDAGHVRVYEWNGSVWLQKGSDIDGEAINDYSGVSVSMADSNTIAIGDYYNDGNGINAGQVRIYKWDGTSWIQKGININGESANDNSGVSVSMPDANTVAIGAYNNDGGGSNKGHVRIYKWNGTSWIQKGLDIDGEATSDQSGISVSMPDTNTVAIGAYNNDGNGASAGHVRVYNWNGSAWIQKGFDIDGEAAQDFSGWAINMSDSNTIAIGAYQNDGNGTDAGHVRVYEWNGFFWAQKGLDINGEFSNDDSGISVSMPDANTLAIGANNYPGGVTPTGRVRIYKWNGSIWFQIGEDIYGESIGDDLGKSVSMPNAYTVAIGAPYNNNGNGLDAGHVRIYKLRGIYGYIFNDINQNCLIDLEPSIANRLAIIQPGNIVVETDSNGVWFLDSLASGNYTITIDTSGNWVTSCSATQAFTVTNPDILTFAPSIGLISTQPCAGPDISVNMPFMRPCFNGQKIYVQVCNRYIATSTLDSAYVIIELDSMITPTSASMAYTDLGNNQLEFFVDTLYPGQCLDFNINTTVSCNAILGQTLCLEANLYPGDSCVFDTIPEPYIGVSPCNTPWDKSSLSVEGSCQNDSICFVITNTGDFGNGNMSCYAPVRLYIDGQLISVDSIQLLGTESISFCYSGDGRTWRLEADQHPFHPGNSHPNATVELCGNANNWTSDLVNILPMNDADPITDIYCGIVTGSYDPNDKRGFPTGITEEHQIRSNQHLEYMIRFQNTGTDTAFTVVIRDTLDENFNIFSVQSGVSSHDYDFIMYGPRVLEWTFNNILLPDSTTDEPGSHGFIKFKVGQQPDLPQGTQLLNDADIYFDFNDPIITNETVHSINDSVGISTPVTNTSIIDTICDQYIYNGLNYSQSGTYWQYIENPIGDSLVTIDVHINESSEYTFSQTECFTFTLNGITYDSSGTYTDTISNINSCDSIITVNLTIKTVDTTITQSGIVLEANNLGVTYQWINCSTNSEITGENNQTFTPISNGNYAVQLTENGCIDTSACYLVNSVGLLESTFDNNLIVYPNPTDGLLQIQLGESFNLIDIEVINIDGKIVINKQFGNKNNLDLDLTSLANGVYIIKLKADDKQAVLRIVKEE